MQSKPTSLAENLEAKSKIGALSVSLRPARPNLADEVYELSDCAYDIPQAQLARDIGLLVKKVQGVTNRATPEKFPELSTAKRHLDVLRTLAVQLQD